MRVLNGVSSSRIKVSLGNKLVSFGDKLVSILGGRLVALGDKLVSVCVWDFSQGNA